MSEFNRVLSILKEDMSLSTDGVFEKIKDTIQKTFPDGYIKKSESKLGPGTSLSVTFASTQPEGWINKIIQNDDGHTIFWIHDAWDKEGKQKTELVMEKPSGSGRAGRGIRWMKAKGLDKILVQIDKYCKAIKQNLESKK